MIYFHGLPGSRHQAELFHHSCIKHGVDLIAPDRFGYGNSDAVQDNRYQLWADCVRELSDAVGFDRYYILGASGGGPYALACASLLRDQVISTAICCGLASLSQFELRQAMHMLAKLAVYLCTSHPQIFRFSYAVLANVAADYFSRFSLKILAVYNGDPDKSFLQDAHTLDILSSDLRCAFLQKSRGAIDDLIASRLSWPFDLSCIQSLQLWHGEKDTVVPISHSEWVLHQIPNARLQVVANEGHISLPFRQSDRIIKALISGNDSHPVL